MTGRPVAIPQVAENASAILETWFAGSEAGNAIADLLFGDYNPAGKLPVSMPYHTGQEPLYYSKKSTGRPVNKDNNVFWSHYTDGPNDALFPFGFGLSYTDFVYTNFEVSIQGEDLKVRVDVSNIGGRDGEEVIQLYIQDLFASQTRPIIELKKFKKQLIKKGESITVDFILTKEDLSFFNNDGELIFEPGKFKISIGTNSVDLLSQTIQID